MKAQTGLADPREAILKKMLKQRSSHCHQIEWVDLDPWGREMGFDELHVNHPLSRWLSREPQLTLLKQERRKYLDKGQIPPDQDPFFNCGKGSSAAVEEITSGREESSLAFGDTPDLSPYFKREASSSVVSGIPGEEINFNYDDSSLTLEATTPNIDIDSDTSSFVTAPSSPYSSFYHGYKPSLVTVLAFNNNAKLQKILDRLPNPGKDLDEYTIERASKRRRLGSDATNVDFDVKIVEWERMEDEEELRMLHEQEEDAELAMLRYQEAENPQFRKLQDEEDALDDEIFLLKDQLLGLERRKREIIRMKQDVQARIAYMK